MRDRKDSRPDESRSPSEAGSTGAGRSTKKNRSTGGGQTPAGGVQSEKKGPGGLRPGKKGRALRALRVVFAAVFFLLFHFALLSTLPVAEDILRVLSRLQFLPAGIALFLAAGSWFAWGFVFVLILTLAAGRAYCSFLCPLGILQDIVIFFSRKVRQKRYGRKAYPFLIHLLPTTVAVGLFAVGVPLLFNLLEPYAFWGRITRDLVMPLASWLSSAASWLARHVDFFFAPLPFYGHVPVVAVTALLFILLVVVTFLRGRWFCNSLCPTGAMLRLPTALSSRIRRLPPRTSSAGNSFPRASSRNYPSGDGDHSQGDRSPLEEPLLPLLKIETDPEKCTYCGICEKVCKTGSIAVDAEEVRIDVETCVLCFNCIAECPFDALSYSPRVGSFRTGRREGNGFSAGRRPTFSTSRPTHRLNRAGYEKNVPTHAVPTHASKNISTRRGFLLRTLRFGGLSVFLAGFVGISHLLGVTRREHVESASGGLLKLRKTSPEGEPLLPATPPGSMSRDRFHASCISCHSCVSVCPTHVLQPSLFEYGFDGFMQPVMDYSSGYCEWECNSCLHVCPTGAIRPLSLKEKQKTQIGRVQFIEDRCVVFTDGTACGACAEVCPSGAVWMVPYERGLTQPKTDNDICVGCGNCEYACPVEGGKAIYVRGNRNHVEREVRKKEKTSPKESEPEEFPF